MTSWETEAAIGWGGKITPTSGGSLTATLVFYQYSSCFAPERVAEPGERSLVKRVGVQRRVRFVVGAAEASHVGGGWTAQCGLHETV